MEPDNGQWELRCDGGCSHDEVARWLAITDLRVSPADDAKAWGCLMLATNPDMWLALIRGEHVPDENLDQPWLRRLRKAGLWSS